MRHWRPRVPASRGSQAEGSGAALASSKICAEIRPVGPGENKSRRASGHLAGHVSLQPAVDHACSPQSRACWSWSCIPTCCSLPLPPRRRLPNPLSLHSSFAPGFARCPKFCSLLPWSSIPIAPPRLPSPYGLRDLERCSPGTGCSPRSTTHQGKDHFPLSEKGQP